MWVQGSKFQVVRIGGRSLYLLSHLLLACSPLLCSDGTETRHSPISPCSLITSENVGNVSCSEHLKKHNKTFFISLWSLSLLVLPATSPSLLLSFLLVVPLFLSPHLSPPTPPPFRHALTLVQSGLELIIDQSLQTFLPRIPHPTTLGSQAGAAMLTSSAL